MNKQEFKEQQQNKIKNNSEAAYRIMCHLKMIDYELESMRDNNIQGLKNILKKASEYYSNTLKISLKAHYINQPEIYKNIIETIEHERMVSLQALFQLQMDCNSQGLEFFYDALINSLTDEEKK